KDAPRFFLRELHLLLSLRLGQCAKRGPGQFRFERQHLVARDQAVAAKERHEPGQTSGGKRMLGQTVRTKAKCRNVYQTAYVDTGGLWMAGENRRGLNPVPQIAPHRVAFVRGEFWIMHGAARHRGHMEVCGPERLRHQRKAKRQVISRLLRGSDRRLDECLPDPVLTLVAQDLTPVSRGLVIGSL